tara:strand:+ start:564 stop:1133 length:570 start_codon:yes stop_codon:yes gene_type:complete
MVKKNWKVTTPVPPLVNIDEIGDSELSLFDQDNPDINLFNLIDDEIIKLSGSKLLLYKYYQSEDFDPVYMEARNKPVSKTPIVVFGHYEPKVLEENLTQFGIELTNDIPFVFNKSYIDRVAGRRIIPGDIIQPEFQEQRYEIFQVQEDSFEVYGVFHLVCSARLLRDAPDVQDIVIEDVTEELGGYDRG